MKTKFLNSVVILGFMLGVFACSENKVASPNDLGVHDSQGQDAKADVQTKDDRGTPNDPGIVKDTGTKDVATDQRDNAVPDVADTLDTGMGKDEIQARKMNISGRVWGYNVAIGNDYTYQPMSGIKVVTHGLQDELSVTTADKDCGSWWTQDKFVCGGFSMDIPKDSGEFYLEAKGSNSVISCISQLFSTDKDVYTFLVMVEQNLIDLAAKLWQTQWNPNRGLVIGLIAKGVDPESSPPVKDMIGDATVALTPEPDNKDFMKVYLDANDVSNTKKQATDAAQSLFFLINVQPGKYKLTTKHQKYTFKPVNFVVEKGKITYLLIIASGQ